MNSGDFITRADAPERPAVVANGSQMHHHPRKSNGLMKMMTMTMVLSLALLILAILALVIFGRNTTDKELVKESQYQAVFLNDSNDQVYFGKLRVINDSYYSLTDVYYVRVDQVQPESSEPQSSFTLVKLGNELHGPEDEMFIPRDKVLFWENLKTDGKIAKGIADQKAGKTSSSETTDSSN